MRTILFTACLVLACDVGLAQESREKPKQLGALSQYVGYWTSDVTSKLAEWSPQEVKYRTTNHAMFMLNGWFLVHSEVSHVVGDPSQVAKSLFVWTYDPSMEKYVGWSFQSSGNISKVTGTWDAVSKTFSHAESEPPPNTTSKLTETFVNNDTINGSLVFTSNNGGGKLFDMVWTRSRRKDLPDPATQERWAMIGKPIQPIPNEVKTLDLFVGTRDVEFIQQPSLTVPQGSTAKGTMSGQWILDGRFLFGETKLPNFQSLWVMGYDTNKRTFRYVLFGSNGLIDENVGKWNEAERVFDWKQVNLAPELTRTSTTRRLDEGRVESHIVTKNQAGQIQLDLTIKATPQK